jgi:hypothetical protein
MTYIFLIVAGLAFSQEKPTPKTYSDISKCYELVVAKGKNQIVEGFYLKDGRPATLDSLIDPVVAQLRTDRRINDAGKVGLKTIQEDMLRGYPCNQYGEVFNPARSLRGFTYTCFPKETGVLRVETQKYLGLKEKLDAINNDSNANALTFNFYLSMASFDIYAGATFLEKSDALSTQVDAATRNRIKTYRSLNDTKDLDKYCSESVMTATKAPANEGGRRRPGRGGL